MNSPHHITISTNGSRSWYATSNLSVLGSHSLRRVLIPFYNLWTRLATAAGSCHPANTQAVEITQLNNVAFLFLWFHLFHNFRHFLNLKTTSMASERRFETWCFSDRASWIDYILITNFCALIIIYS